MDTDFPRMRPSSLSEREQQCYRAERMLLRQFMLMKQKFQVPIYLSMEDMKAWLLAGRSFLQEFQEKEAEPRKLLMAELVWTSGRCHCLNQMEEELQEELEKERRLSLLFSREVTVEGLQMFLSAIRPKAEWDVCTFLRHLSSKLLSSHTGSHTSKRSELALIAKLNRVTAPLNARIVDIALRFLLDESEALAEVKSSQTLGVDESRDFTLPSALKNSAEAASVEVGKLLADTVAPCFCLNTFFSRARLLAICTSVSQDMVKAIYKRLLNRSKTFQLMNFDESFVIARSGVICAIQDMDDRAQRALHQHLTDQDPVTPEVCSVKTNEEEEDKRGERGVRAFFIRMWKKMIHTSTEE